MRTAMNRQRYSNVTKIVKCDLKRHSQPHAPAWCLIRSARHLPIQVGTEAPLLSKRHAGPSAHRRFLAADEVSTDSTAQANPPLRCPDFTPDRHPPLLARSRHRCRQIGINRHRARSNDAAWAGAERKTGPGLPFQRKRTGALAERGLGDIPDR